MNAELVLALLRVERLRLSCIIADIDAIGIASNMPRPGLVEKNRIPSYRVGHPVLPRRTYGRQKTGVRYVLPRRT
jgi:hypothetical protein